MTGAFPAIAAVVTGLPLAGCLDGARTVADGSTKLSPVRARAALDRSLPPQTLPAQTLPTQTIRPAPRDTRAMVLAALHTI